MGRLDGTVSITGLSPHRGLILRVCFYPVEAAAAPAPYAGDPPASAATDIREGEVKRLELLESGLPGANS